VQACTSLKCGLISLPQNGLESGARRGNIWCVSPDVARHASLLTVTLVLGAFSACSSDSDGAGGGAGAGAQAGGAGSAPTAGSSALAGSGAGIGGSAGAATSAGSAGTTSGEAGSAGTGGGSGGSGGSGGASSGGSGAAGTAGATTSSCLPSYALCEDFEATSVGATPSGWTAHGMASVADDQANRGKHALKVSPANNGERRIYHDAAVLGAQHWGRVYYRVQLPTPTAFVHSTLVAFAGTGPTVGTAEFRVVDTVKNAGNDSATHQFLYNVQPQGAEFGTGSSYDWSFDGN